MAKKIATPILPIDYVRIKTHGEIIDDTKRKT